MVLDVRQVGEADEKWYNGARRDSARRAAGGGLPPAQKMKAAEKPKADRPRKPRFLLREPHPLADTHMPMMRAKWGVPAFAGEGPRVGRGPVSSAARRQRRK